MTTELSDMQAASIELSELEALEIYTMIRKKRKALEDLKAKNEKHAGARSINDSIKLYRGLMDKFEQSFPFLATMLWI